MKATRATVARRAAPQEGAPVDLVPWTYVWRADRKVQSSPEAYFIPRRLARLDRIYRTAKEVLPPDQLKSIYYDQRDLLKPFPPKPDGRLQVGLLWTGGLSDFEVTLSWPSRSAIPNPKDVEVRSYPTSFGWFGFTVDRVLDAPTISADGRTWVYCSAIGEMMDTSYSVHVPAATEMIAVFCRPDVSGAYPAVPGLRLTSANLGRWRRDRLVLKWMPGASLVATAQGVQLEGSTAEIESIEPLADSGVVVTLLWAPDARPGLDSRVTVAMRPEPVTFSVKDLRNGPILLPRHRLFVAWADESRTINRFTDELISRSLASIRAKTAAHREPSGFEELMQEVRLWTCPPGAKLTPFPPVPDPPMRVELSDHWWTDAWRAACHQLTGAHMWGGLAFEVARVTHAMEMVGLHEHAEKVYEHFLKAPGARPDGDYSDGKGALEWATSMRHEMGYSHDGTHASTGRLLFSMAERVFLTGDVDWLRSRRERLQAAADWIIRQRRTYLAEAPNRGRLFAAGLLPPCMLGDYALPACDWHWYYVDNALAVQGLRRFADALKLIDSKAAARYRKEAEAFARDLRRVVEKEAARSPVRLGRDGYYHSFIPRMAYARGLIGPELGAPQFPESDWWMGALPLAEPMAGIDANDPRMIDTLDMMEEMGTSPAAIAAQEEARRKKGLPHDDAWYWHTYSILPKASHVANVYLLQDDIPNFLRFWMNQYAAMVGADGKLWEHSHLGGFDVCGAPDNGTAGWFLENFRNALVMEEGTTLWIARGTPRAWLAQGKRIEVKDAPTAFGPAGYDIVSDTDNGRITAVLVLPRRSPAKTVLLRLRHPTASPMRSVKVNGARWKQFDPAKETVRLDGLSGEVVVEARY